MRNIIILGFIIFMDINSEMIYPICDFGVFYIQSDCIGFCCSLWKIIGQNRQKTCSDHRISDIQSVR